MLSPKQAAQPNPSYPALCREETTSPWSTDYEGNSYTLILMPAIKNIWKKYKKKKEETFSSEKMKKENEKTFFFLKKKKTKNEEMNRKRKNEKIKSKKKDKKRWKKKVGKKRKRGPKGVTFPRRPKNCFFTSELSREIVTKLMPKKNQILSTQQRQRK